MLFGGNVVRSDRWVILSYMVPLLIISDRYDVIELILKAWKRPFLSVKGHLKGHFSRQIAIFERKILLIFGFLVS